MADSAMPTAGETFDGRYEIVEELGRGGFGRVFLATNSLTTPRVALKVLDPRRLDQQSKARFLREARVQGRINHPNVVHMLHAGEAGGLPYIATEYVEGENLAEVLGARGRLPTHEAVAMLRQLLNAVAVSHRAGLIHRDIKPENVLVTAEGVVKLLDFGIARDTQSGAPSLTNTGEFIGTPRYMAPEQLRERPTTPASDIYSLGLVGVELLLGRDALHGGAMPAQLDRLMPGHVVAADRFDEIEPALGVVLRRMTAREPDDRYSSAGAVLAALDGESTAFEFEPRPTESRRWIAAVALFVVLVLGALYATRDSPEPRPLTSVSAQALLATAPVDVGSTEALDAPETTTETASGEPETCGFLDLPLLHDDDFELFEVPRSCAESACPLVIIFHSGEPNPEALYSQLRRLAREFGFVVAVPTWKGRVDTHWDDSFTIVSANELHAEAARRVCFDRGRVFTVGIAGAARALTQMDCPPWVTATAVFGQRLLRPLDLECEAERMRPVLWLHPLDGTSIPKETQITCKGDSLPTLGFEDTSVMLRDEWNAAAGPVEVELPLQGGRTCERWGGEASVTMCGVRGGERWLTTASRGLTATCPPRRDTQEDIGRIMFTYFGQTPARMAAEKVEHLDEF